MCTHLKEQNKKIFKTYEVVKVEQVQEPAAPERIQPRKPLEIK